MRHQRGGPGSPTSRSATEPATQEWDQDLADLAVFQLVETTADHIRRARQVQRLLASPSQRGRKIPDLLIAAAAGEEAKLILQRG